jgi:hypothetical protein
MQGLAAAFLISALSLANAISIGWRSGLEGDRHRNHAPRSRRTVAAAGLLGLEIVRTDNVAGPERRDQLGLNAKGEHPGVYRSSITPGRVRPVMAQAATKAWLRQCPDGA